MLKVLTILLLGSLGASALGAVRAFRAKRAPIVSQSVPAAMRLLAAMGLVWNVGASLFYAAQRRVGEPTVYDMLGPYMLVPLTVPIVLGIPPLLASGARQFSVLSALAAFAISVFCVVSSFSIGLLYPPGALAIAVAGILTLRERHSIREP